MNIKIENLSKKLDDNVILEDVNLCLEENNIYGFVGRNGSGKSVLFKIISGFYKPTSGKVLVDNVDIHSKKEFLPDARILIEKPSFLPDVSGLDNLIILSKIQNKITIEDINKILDVVNISDSDRKKPYHKYSLGMKQKLGIAQVLMEDPKIMIFDEPFNGIEEETVDKIKKHLKSICGGKIILLCSHVKDDISDLCNVVYKIDNKKIEIIDNDKTKSN